MSYQSSEISLELNEFILEETHNRKSIEIGFTPTFKSSDIDTFLKTLTQHADLKLIELLCEFMKFNVFLSVDVQYVRDLHRFFTMRVNSFTKSIDRSTDTYRSIKQMLNDVADNNGLNFNGGTDIVLHSVMYARLYISEFSTVPKPIARRKLSMQSLIFYIHISVCCK